MDAVIQRGTIANVASWKWLFAINVPVGIFTVISAHRALPPDAVSATPLTALPLRDFDLSVPFVGGTVGKSPWTSSTGWMVSLFFAFHSTVFYPIISWYSSFVASRGISLNESGFHLLVYQVIAVSSNLACGPILKRAKSQVYLGLVCGGLLVRGTFAHHRLTGRAQSDDLITLFNGLLYELFGRIRDAGNRAGHRATWLRRGSVCTGYWWLRHRNGGVRRHGNSASGRT